jgi:gliding motility-associated-like protein
MTFTNPFLKARHWLLAVSFILLCYTSSGQKLEVTGQKALSVEVGKSITLQLSDFTVKGSGDDRYPRNFKLEVFDGENYSASGTTVTPDAGFTGTLKVIIKISRVKDGAVKAETERTEINVDVKPATSPPIGNTPPQIIGQQTIRIFVDETVKIIFNHLTVFDPDNTYPTGFSIKLLNGSNYTVEPGNTVVPAPGFMGTLVVKTIVNDGKVDSQPFDLKISVVERNSPEPPTSGVPVFVTFSESTLGYSLGSTQFLIAREVEIDDADSDELFYAEVYFDAEGFVPGKDVLAIETFGNLNSVFDANVGILVLFGRESLTLYQQALRSLRYHFASDTMPSVTHKKVYFRLNDGENTSVTKSKSIRLNQAILLDIPNAFSPNDDHANDLWVIRPSRADDNLIATVRVFDKRGMLLFETNDLSNFWDGKSNGKTVPADAYFYTIDVTVGVNRARHQGTVTILR